MSAGGVQGWLRRPLFGAPDWMFAPAWTLLHVTTGVAAWLVWRRVEVGLHRKRAALRLWGWQLLACALWPAAFFGLHTPGVALAVIVAAALGVGLTMRAFWRLQRMAAGLMLPYAAWIGFGTWLNAGFWWLGHGSAILGP